MWWGDRINVSKGRAIVDRCQYMKARRTVALGYLVESLEGLCGPHLWVLDEISSALYELRAADGEHGEETPRHHTH